MSSHVKGALVEYALAVPPLALVFDFNPQSITRTRTATIATGNAPGTRGGYPFSLPTDTPRVAQGVTVEPETFSIEILLDATDRMNEGDPIALAVGVEPEIDTLRLFVEPKAQGPAGLQTLASLTGDQRAFQRDQSASVVLFVWGTHVLPVFIASVSIAETAHAPWLIPYRANATISMRVIEGDNPFTTVENVRRAISAAVNTTRTAASVLGGLF